MTDAAAEMQQTQCPMRKLFETGQLTAGRIMPEEWSGVRNNVSGTGETVAEVAAQARAWVARRPRHDLSLRHRVRRLVRARADRPRQVVVRLRQLCGRLYNEGHRQQSCKRILLMMARAMGLLMSVSYSTV